jgi:very-short-patch-repair endonuclease
VDVLWRPQGLVVELDGGAAHGTPSAVSRDRHRELVLRERGFRVLRYSFRQIVEEPGRVVADLRAALS